MAKYIRGKAKFESDVTIEGDLTVTADSELLIDGSLEVKGSLILESYSVLKVTGLTAEFVTAGVSSKTKVSGCMNVTRHMIILALGEFRVTSKSKVGGCFTIQGSGDMYCDELQVTKKISLKSSILRARGDISAESLLITDNSSLLGRQFVRINTINSSKSGIRVAGKLFTNSIEAVNSNMEGDVEIQNAVLNGSKLLSMDANIKLLKLNGGAISGNQIEVTNATITGCSSLRATELMKIKESLKIKDSNAQFQDITAGDFDLVVKGNSKLEILTNLTTTGDVSIKSRIGGFFVDREALVDERASVEIQGKAKLKSLSLQLATGMTVNDMCVESISNGGVIYSKGDIVCENTLFNRGKVIVSNNLDSKTIDNYGVILVSGGLTSNYINCKSYSDLTVRQDTTIKQMIVEQTDSLELTGNVVIEKLTLYETKIETNGSLKVDKLRMERKSKIKANQRINIKKAKLYTGSTIESSSSLVLETLSMKHKCKVTASGIYILKDAVGVYSSCMVSDIDIHIHGSLCIDSNTNDVSHLERLIGNENSLEPRETSISIKCDRLIVKNIEKVHRPLDLEIGSIFAERNSEDGILDVTLVNDISTRLRFGL